MQNTIDTILLTVLKDVVLPLVTLALTWASAKLPVWITAHIKNAKIAGIMTRLEQLAMSVVQEMDQTVIQSLGNNPTVEQLKAARDAALATLKSHLGTNGIQEIEQVLGLENEDAVIKLLITFIESNVHSLKLVAKVPA
jgi:hypothetical protein